MFIVETPPLVSSVLVAFEKSSTPAPRTESVRLFHCAPFRDLIHIRSGWNPEFSTVLGAPVPP